jgi:esterase/lipase superfamily enzyme
MHIGYHKDYSQFLSRDMEYKVYGERGKPVIAFPTSFGQFWQWEDMGMIDAVAPFIDDGRIMVFTVDGLDRETLKSDNWDKKASIHRYDQYMNYMRAEMLPAALDIARRANEVDYIKATVTGASMGAVHAANFFFHQPWDVDQLIAMSGAYAMVNFFGDYLPDEIFAYSPLNYMHHGHVDSRWEAYQLADIVLACGQGAWEEPMLTETKLLAQVLRDRSIPVWEDLWGHDQDHDWPLWRKMLPYYLGELLPRKGY